MHVCSRESYDAKTRIFQLHFYVADSVGLLLVSVMQLAPKATTFGEMMQNNGHYKVHGHSRLVLSVAIESPCATSY